MLETNLHLKNINKHVIAFIESNQSIVDESVKSRLIDEWNDKQNANRLKSIVRKIFSKNPKRLSSKYLFFCADERVKIIEEHPEMNIKQVTCELGARWKAFNANPDPERMEMITRLFEEDKKRYDDAKVEIKSNEKPQKKIKRSNYVVFCDRERKRCPKMTIKEIAVLWRRLKDDVDEYESFNNYCKTLA